ncbi:MAG: DNA repair protein RecN [Zoogloeaceae bacterium]|jgi:DNA repair protein RecN (Recombination protein N)|nr:DNA repair protein RecN [Zoogloeaceae bacterium]
MLLLLTLKDFVIVDRLELEFDAGFGTLTGETGAGKSILIDALALALGERADAGVIREGREKTEITATFDLAQVPEAAAWLAGQEIESEDGTLILRRVLDRSGRSRAAINGVTVTLQQLREVGEFLVDIHGQHAHQSLLRADAQRERLDAHGDLLPLAREVAAAWKTWKQAEKQLAAAQTAGEANASERERLVWQLEEGAALNLAADEWPELEAEQRRLSHAAGLIEDAQCALAALADEDASCVAQVSQALVRVEAMAAVDTALAETAGLLASVEAELTEAVSGLRRYADHLELDPARLAEVDARMSAILSFARKYRTEPEAIPARMAEWQTRLEGLAAAADVASLQQQVEAEAARWRALATRLSAGRQKAGKALSAAVSEQMRALALANGRFEVALIPVAGGAAFGLEQVEFRIAGLAQQEARPLVKVASGGELSRISLALQVVTAQNASVPTLIFDEVDVGIGGGVAEIVGRLLARLGAERQVLCVTHLPQVAACARWHWQVRKYIAAGLVSSHIETLDDNARVEEIARMLGGVDLTATTRQHAREMLAGAAHHT